MNIKTKKLISKKSKNKNKKSKSKKKEIKIELKGGAGADKVIQLQKTTDFSSFKYEMIAALKDMELDIESGIRANPFTYYIPEDGSKDKLINVLKAKPLGAGSFGAVYKTEMILGIGGQKGDYIIKTDFGEKNSILQDAQNLLMREARMINIISNGVDDKKKKKMLIIYF